MLSDFSLINSLLKHIRRFHSEAYEDEGLRNDVDEDVRDGNGDDDAQNETPDVCAEGVARNSALFLLKSRSTTPFSSVTDYIDATKSLVTENVKAIKNQVIKLFEDNGILTETLMMFKNWKEILTLFQIHSKVLKLLPSKMIIFAKGFNLYLLQHGPVEQDMISM